MHPVAIRSERDEVALKDGKEQPVVLGGQVSHCFFVLSKNHPALSARPALMVDESHSPVD